MWGKCIITLDTILLAGTIAFMCIEIYKKMIEIYEAWKETQNRCGPLKKGTHQEELTRREMTDISFNQNNLLENSSSFKRSLSAKRSQIFPISQSNHLDLQPWEPKDEAIFEENRAQDRTIQETSPRKFSLNTRSISRDSASSSRRYVRRIPSKIHPDFAPLPSETESSSYYFKSNYNNVQNEAEVQSRQPDKSSSNFVSFAEPSLSGPFNYSAFYQSPQVMQAQPRNTMRSIHEDQQNEERVEDQAMKPEGSKLRRRIKRIQK